MTVVPVSRSRRRRLGDCRRRRLLPLLLTAVAVSTSWAADLDRVPGYVDGSRLMKLVGDDCVTLEVNFSRSLIRILTSFDPDLKELAGGLQNIHAVILDLTECGDRAATAELRDEADDIERSMLKRGWERVAMMREADATVRVLLLLRDDLIDGLVVLVTGEEELVFTNIAGTIDLAKLRELAEGMELPGLDDIDFNEIERERKRKNEKRNGKD